MSEQLVNGGLTTLSEELDASETAIDVTDGSVFPSTGNFRVICDNEIMLCTSRSTNTLTVTRGVESTTATVHANGTEIAAVLTSSGMDQWHSDLHLNDYILIRDEKAQNTDGGTFTSGAWRTRDLNTEVYDSGGHASVASNQITLEAGTYEIKASAPAYLCARHQLMLYNITDSAVLITGLDSWSVSSAPGGQVHAFLSGRFTITAQKIIELQHRCETTSATLGFGVACNFTTEIYATIELWKID